jgi:hypothetical protein
MGGVNAPQRPIRVRVNRASIASRADSATRRGESRIPTMLLSNHTEFDNGDYKTHTAANRKGTDVANPFEVGANGVAGYFTVIDNCATAAKLRSAKK